MNCLRFRHHLTLGIVAVMLVLATPRIDAAEGNQRVYAPLVMLASANQENQPISLLSSEEQDVLDFTNQLRATIGCPALVVNPSLQTASKGYSQYMADTNSWGHVGANGSTPASRAADAGYDGLVGENIAMGYQTAADVFEGWRTSSGHYKNLTNCSYRDIGIGLGRSANGTTYWTQDFGIPR